ncbi:MAG: hypothetical protein JWN36_2733 [Microbacteriaceae bacterium]|nr:hypothetical protein [Microbacteriaceae bacterium]
MKCEGVEAMSYTSPRTDSFDDEVLELVRELPEFANLSDAQQRLAAKRLSKFVLGGSSNAPVSFGQARIELSRIARAVDGARDDNRK